MAIMGRFRRALPASLTLLAGMAIAGTTWAHTFVVVRPEPSDAMLNEAFNRLCGELHMYGLEVTILAHDGGASPGDRPPADAGGDALGGVVFVRSGGQASAKIWINEATPGKESVHITISIAEADAPSWLAIRAADLLRAGLRELDRNQPERSVNSPAPATGLSSAMPAPSPVVSQGIPRWAVSGGASTLWETGNLGAGLAVSLGIARRLSSRTALELAIVAPVTGQAYASTEATARMRQALGTLGLAWRPLDRRALTLDLIQGFGAMHLSVQGDSVQSPWLAQAGSAWAAASSTAARFGLGLSRHAGLAVSLAAVFLLPRPVLEVADVSYGLHQPLLLATAEFRYGF